VGRRGGDIKESLLRECFELLFTISGHFLFNPGGFELIPGSSLGFVGKCGNPGAGNPRPEDNVLGRTLCVGGKDDDDDEDAGMVNDGDMDVRLLLVLYDSDAEDALPGS